MQSVANPEISISADVPSSPVKAVFDARLVGQALTNVVKNAAEAVSARTGDNLPKGKVTVHLRGEAEGGGRIVIDVIDNGIGLPEENRSRLLEPYMTTREKGTGLGLAIVRKILEDHGGGIELLDAPKTKPEDTGTLVRLTLAAHAEIEAETDLQHQTVTAHGA
jgi:two-component system nitrogen regulation sensor histidine kinase NtrY